MFDINKTIEQIKKVSNLDNLGMILVHNGVVRGTSKSGKKVRKMLLIYDKQKLDGLVKEVNKLSFVESCIIWINEGELSIGDDIMYVILAGNNRKKLLPLFEDIIETLKNSVVEEKEL